MRVNGRTESRKNVYFVSGIDTGIGKTAVTGLMARSRASAGRDAVSYTHLTLPTSIKV